jgi:hypothetical protein
LPILTKHRCREDAQINASSKLCSKALCTLHLNRSSITLTLTLAFAEAAPVVTSTIKHDSAKFPFWGTKVFDARA